MLKNKQDILASFTESRLVIKCVHLLAIFLGKHTQTIVVKNLANDGIFVPINFAFLILFIMGVLDRSGILLLRR